MYRDKISETIENIDNEAMRQGRDLEDYVAQRFTEATGLKVRLSLIHIFIYSSSLKNLFISFLSSLGKISFFPQSPAHK